MKNKLFIISLFSFCLGSAQNVGINTSTPDDSAVLEINASDRGLLIPRVALKDISDVVTIEQPATSLLVYNTATDGTSPDNVTPGFYYWDGTVWKRLEGGNAGGTTNNDWALTGNAGTNAGTNFVGTTDNQDLVFKRSGQPSGRINPQYTSFGLKALGSGLSGVNIAFGNQALENFYSKNGGNTAIGIQSQRYNSAARANTSVGFRALEALPGETGSDDGNTAIGHSSLKNLGAGRDNIALGYNALKFLESGSNNLGIGKDIDLPAYNGNYTTYTASNQMNIMNVIYGLNMGSQQDDDLIGIATRNPSQTLDVGGNLKVRGKNVNISSGNPCTDPGTISFGSDGNFYGCTGSMQWKLLNSL